MPDFITQNFQEIVVAGQQLLVYVHLFAFAFAIVIILSEDAKIFFSKQINVVEVRKVSTKITYLLGVLWLSGVVLLSIDPGLDLSTIFANPKLAAKITIVLILTFNGFLLHLLVFPSFKSKEKAQRIVLLSCILTAISTTSWIFAGLIGAARAIAPLMNYQMFMITYAVVLSIALMITVFIAYPFMRTIISSLEYEEPSVESDSSSFSDSSAL